MAASINKKAVLAGGLFAWAKRLALMSSEKRFERNEKSRYVVMSTAELSGIHIRELGVKAGTLKDLRTEIIAALDFLFMGF